MFGRNVGNYQTAPRPHYQKGEDLWMNDSGHVTTESQGVIYSRVYKHPVFYGTQPFVNTIMRSVSSPEAGVSIALY